MSTSTSYQLPDLLALIRDFDLHANPSCREVTTASENGLLASLEFQDLEVFVPDGRHGQGTLHGAKSGLLAALCCPTCDAPQLRLVTDFLTLLNVLINARKSLSTTDRTYREWIEESSGTTSRGCLAITNHVLFRHIAPRVLQHAEHAHPSWTARFDRSTLALRAAQVQLDSDLVRGIVPHLDAYMDLRRNLSGLRMLFDLIELAEGLKLSDEVVDAPLVKKLTDCAIDIIAWSTDIVSYHLEQLRGNKHNLVAVLIAENGYSVQNAVNVAATLAKQSIDTFIATERLLLGQFEKNSPRSSHTSPWPSSSQAPWDSETERDVRLYVRGLRDCVAGFINWMYETELFFGDKGSEVRSFGWIFLMDKS